MGKTLEVSDLEYGLIKLALVAVVAYAKESGKRDIPVPIEKEQFKALFDKLEQQYGT